MGIRPGLSHFSGRTGIFFPEAAGRHCASWFGNAVWGLRFRGHYPTAMGSGARNFRASYVLFLLMPGHPRTTGGRPRPDEGIQEASLPIRTAWQAQYTYVQEAEAETPVSTSRPYAGDSPAEKGSASSDPYRTVLRRRYTDEPTETGTRFVARSDLCFSVIRRFLRAS